MLYESATVVGLQADNILLQTDRHSTCTGCTLKGGCGQYLLSRDRENLLLSRSSLVKVPDNVALQAGDHVQVTLASGPFLRLVAWHYLLPLAGLLLATILASFGDLPEPAVVIVGFTGLAVGFLLAKYALRDMQTMPGIVASTRTVTNNTEETTNACP
jgi:sigma-E factor negative regulatory protein RseC